MHLWKAGELITADKLTPRILAGDEFMTFPTAVGDYFRGERRITFPQGFFKNPPMLAITARTSVPGVFMEASYTAKSAEGFTLCAARSTTTETWIDWVAIEVPQY